MRARVISGLGLLAGLGAFFRGMGRDPFFKALPIQPREAAPRINSRDGRSNNPRGTVPNRGLKRIQGRQAAR